MNKRRWELLMVCPIARLTLEEIEEGWHFCPDWDGLLVGPDMVEWEACGCVEIKRTEGPKNDD